MKEAVSVNLPFRSIKLYTVSTETAASRPSGVRLFSGPFTAMFHDVVAEWAVYATGALRVDPSTRREILRIAQYKSDHNTDQLMFNPTAKVGQPDYGKLYIGTGDGGNTPDHPDMYNHAQDPKRALGKILRIDPLAQSGGRRYGVPADNPHFVNRPDWLPEIWAMGFRHPQNLSFDRLAGGFSTTPISANTGSRRSTSSWPAATMAGRCAKVRSSRTATIRPSFTSYRRMMPPTATSTPSPSTTTAKAARSRAASSTAAPPCRSSRGSTSWGTSSPAASSTCRWTGSTSARRRRSRSSGCSRGGSPVTLRRLVGGTNGRVDLRFGQDEAGEMYVLTKQDGKIRKIAAA